MTLCDIKCTFCFPEIKGGKLLLAQFMWKQKCLWSTPIAKAFKIQIRRKKNTKPLKYLLHSEFTEVLVTLSIILYPEENCTDAQTCRYARTDGAILQKERQIPTSLYSTQLYGNIHALYIDNTKNKGQLFW